MTSAADGTRETPAFQSTWTTLGLLSMLLVSLFVDDVLHRVELKQAREDNARLREEAALPRAAKFSFGSAWLCAPETRDFYFGGRGGVSFGQPGGAIYVSADDIVVSLDGVP